MLTCKDLPCSDVSLCMQQVGFQGAMEQQVDLFCKTTQPEPVSPEPMQAYSGAHSAARYFSCMFQFSHARLTEALLIALAGLEAQDVILQPRIGGISPVSRGFQKDNWTWDVFICHAGSDKPFALALSKRLPAELRCFVDESSLLVGDSVVEHMEHAVKSAQIAVVLLSRAFFSREDPQRELRWVLDNCLDGRTTLVPVYLGITVEQCSELAKDSGQGLDMVFEHTGVRHLSERSTVDGRGVTREDTMHNIVYHVRALTGV